jgi:DNA-binding XRE family transcriptional regulator
LTGSCQRARLPNIPRWKVTPEKEGPEKKVETRIKELLAEVADRDWDKRLTQEELARRVGISVFTLNRIAGGKRRVGKQVQKTIARELGRALGRKLSLEDVFPAPKAKAEAR